MKITTRRLVAGVLLTVLLVAMGGMFHAPIPVHLPYGLHVPHLNSQTLQNGLHQAAVMAHLSKATPKFTASPKDGSALAAEQFNNPAFMRRRLESCSHVTLNPSYDPDKEPSQPILPRLLYWLDDGKRDPKGGVLDRGSFELPPLRPGKYLLFGTDLGGFNNIRMSFEVYTTIAALEGRTLVLPPPHGWYLLDFGRPQDLQGPGGGLSDYSEFWELADLNTVVPVITAQEFLKREMQHFKFPFTDVSDPAHSQYNHEEHKFYAFFNSFRGKANQDDVAFCEGHPDDKVVWWPTIKAVQEAIGNNQDILEHYTMGKQPYELSQRERNSKVLYMPQWMANRDPAVKQDYRFFTNAASYVLYADDKFRRMANRIKRNHMHYTYEIFYVASRVIRFLGPGNYTSLHVRRGDLQYETSFIAAEQTINNIKALLKPGETLYISTDEKPEFFRAIRESGHPVFHFSDFLTTVLSDLTLDYNMIGMVEQVICSQGRRFFGTKLSTFSAYIFRMRGYNRFVEPKLLQYHNTKYSGDENEDKRESLEAMTPHNWGMEYLSTWEDIY